MWINEKISIADIIARRVIIQQCGFCCAATIIIYFTEAYTYLTKKSCWVAILHKTVNISPNSTMKFSSKHESVKYLHGRNCNQLTA